MESKTAAVVKDVRQPFASQQRESWRQRDSTVTNGNCHGRYVTQRDRRQRRWREKQACLGREFAEMFEKKYKYQAPASNSVRQWQLPPPEELFSEYYQFDSLQQLKDHLNSVKSKLNDYPMQMWCAHTSRTEPSGSLTGHLKAELGTAEFITVAWCKFFECLHHFPLVKGPQLNSLHLCEAPGAFINALNHYMYATYERDEVKWNWLATTYNPYYEGNRLNKMLIDDRLILYTLDRWLFHDDFTGNIIDYKNIENIKIQCKQRFDGGEVHLITADGSIDCMEEPESQEEIVSLLHFAEICAALNILAEGGCFVLKMFTLFESASVSKIYLLNCMFEEVHVFKPPTSKRGNSENYIICLGFKKSRAQNFDATLAMMKLKLNESTSQLPILRKSHIPKDFLLQHEICTRRFMYLQINAIESNIRTYELNSNVEVRRRYAKNMLFNKYFCDYYKVQPLLEDLTILHKYQGTIIKYPMYYARTGSYAERKRLSNITMEEQIFMLRTRLNELEQSHSVEEDILFQEKDLNEQEMLEFTFYNGATYDILHCSLFATVPSLLMRQKLMEIFDHIDPAWYGAPKCLMNIDKEGSKQEQTIALASATDDATTTNFTEMQRNLMLNILTTIQRERPQSIIFSNFAFLTHLSVSILRYLSQNFFNNFIIAIRPNCEIKLQNCVYNEKCMNMLETLINKLQSDNNLLCVIDMLNLHHNKFQHALTQFNETVFLNNFRLILNEESI